MELVQCLLYFVMLCTETTRTKENSERERRECQVAIFFAARPIAICFVIYIYAYMIVDRKSLLYTLTELSNRCPSPASRAAMVASHLPAQPDRTGASRALALVTSRRQPRQHFRVCSGEETA